MDQQKVCNLKIRGEKEKEKWRQWTELRAMWTPWCILTIHVKRRTRRTKETEKDRNRKIQMITVNISNSMKNINLHTWEVQCNSRRINTDSHPDTPWLKCLKKQNKWETLKAVKEKSLFQGNINKINNWLLIWINGHKKQWDEILKVLKGK